MPKLRRTMAILVVTLTWFASGPLSSFAAQGDPGTGGKIFEHVHALAIDAEGRALFLGAHTGFFRSDDGGRSWQKVAISEKHSHLALAVGPGEQVVFATTNSDVSRSRDGGKTWQRILERGRLVTGSR